jgi:hypothetical protein
VTQTILEYFVANPNEYAPKVDKPASGQYDNFQMNDFYCNDTTYQELVIDGNTIDPPASSLFNNFLAVQKVSPTGEIDCDFEAIALTYP